MKNGEYEYHLKLREGDVGAYCILPGDPGRCESIARHFDDAKFVMSNREYTTYTGTLLGEKVSVVSTGIGGPSASICMEELHELGVHTFIRVGTCGGMNPKIEAGDCVIATGAVRMEGTSREYAPMEFPAVANFDVTLALVQAAQRLGKQFHVGVVQCKDSFYGQHDPGSMPVGYELKDKWEAWKKLGVLASEMESAALFTVAAARDLRCGSVFHVVWNQESKGGRGAPTESTADAIAVGVEALKLLIERDHSDAPYQY